MIKKLNHKGFTLVELLATIAILGLIGSVTFVAITKYYEISKQKSEEAFEKQLKGYVDDYLALYGSKLKYGVASSYGNNGTVQKCYLDGTETKCSDTVLSKAEINPTFQDVNEKIINEEIFNPATNVKCDNNLTINVYRDSDFVYCFTIKPNGSSCIDEEEKINSCEGIYKYNNIDITLD